MDDQRIKRKAARGMDSGRNAREERRVNTSSEVKVPAQKEEGIVAVTVDENKKK